MGRGDNFKGHKPPGSGRSKGRPNRVTEDVRAAIAVIAQENIGNFGSWMQEIEDPARRCEVFLKLLVYHLPQLAKVESSFVVRRRLEDLSDGELLALVGDQRVGEEEVH